MRSLVFPWLHFWAFSHSSCYLCLTPDCPTLELWTCACDLDLCLVLFTSLLCLWYSCYARWPLPVWFCRCLINIYYCTWIPCLWPVFTEDFANSDPAASSHLPSSTMDSISLLLHLRQGGLTMEEYVHQFCELSYQVPLYDEYLFKNLFYFGLRWSRSAHRCLRWSRSAHRCLRWSRPAHRCLRWFRPAHQCLRWFRPAHRCLRWFRPAHRCLRWFRPAHRCLRWFRPVLPSAQESQSRPSATEIQRFQSAPSR